MAKVTSNHLEITVQDSDVGQRLDQFLARIPEVQTRSRAGRMIREGRVRLKGRPLKASYLVQSGDLFHIQIPEAGDTENIAPLAMDLDILFEDSALIVVNKPAGLVVHPAAGHAQDTLVNALVHHTKDLSMGFNENRPGIVHRLDKDTSGLLVVAKTDADQLALAKQFRERSVRRLYWALCHGQFRQLRGTQISHLRRHPKDRKRFSSDPSGRGKIAITHYEVQKYHPSGVSLVFCRLETGRTHQIRVHLSELGHPLLGDRLYGGARAKSLGAKTLRQEVSGLRRIGLHAAELGFQHPRTGEELRFSAPWPEDLRPVLSCLEWE